MRDLPDKLREYRVRIVPAERAGPAPAYPSNLGLRTKFGGRPDAIQGDDDAAVDCPTCGRRMHFVAQIDSFEHMAENNPRAKDSIDRQFMFGDVGMIYVYFCFGCLMPRATMECYWPRVRLGALVRSVAMEQRAPSHAPPSTLADYFAAELASPQKHEFRHGRIIAMAGADEPHVLVAGNIHGELRDRLKGSTCRSYANELRILSSRRNSGYCYPDVSVVCGPSEYDPKSTAAKLKTITNPRLVVEVLSESTEADDRGDKFDGYREIPTLEQYVLVAQDQAYVLTFTRQDGGGWLMLPYLGLDAMVPLASIGVTIPMAEIYANVSFPVPELPHPSA